MTTRWIWLVPSQICLIVDQAAVASALGLAAGGDEAGRRGAVHRDHVHLRR